MISVENWMREYPLTLRLERVWDGCGWVECMEDFCDEPLGSTPTLETLNGWRWDTLARRKRIWAKAEQFFGLNPEEYKRLLAVGQRPRILEM